MKRISIRLRLMLTMICLTTLPVIIVTSAAAYSSRVSVENEIISSNNARMITADQYLSELIRQINALFYSLQINAQLMESLDHVDSSDLDVQFRAQAYVRETLNSALYANVQRIDELTLYIHYSQRAYSVSFADSGTARHVDLKAGPWSRMLNGPINLYFNQSNGIDAFHSINRFENRQLIGGLSARISRGVWSQVSEILHPEPGSTVWLLGDDGAVLSSPVGTAYFDEMHAQLRTLDPQDTGPTFLRTDRAFYFIKRVGGGQMTIVKAIPLTTVTRSTRATIKAGLWTGGLFSTVSVALAILLSLRISQPIVRLAETMRDAHAGEFDVPLVQSHDEIGLLDSGYQSMMQRIKDLIAAKYFAVVLRKPVRERLVANAGAALPG